MQNGILGKLLKQLYCFFKKQENFRSKAAPVHLQLNIWALEVQNLAQGHTRKLQSRLNTPASSPSGQLLLSCPVSRLQHAVPALRVFTALSSVPYPPGGG